MVKRGIVNGGELLIIIKRILLKVIMKQFKEKLINNQEKVSGDLTVVQQLAVLIRMLDIHLCKD